MTPNQVFWHRILLVISVALIIAAYVNGFRISNAILSPDYRLATILTFASSFCLVMGIKECAKNFFNMEDKLWYASFSGFIFISFILLIFYSIFLALTIIVNPIVKRALRPEQMQFLLPAFAILLIVILQKPPIFKSSSYRHYPPERVSRRLYKPIMVFRLPVKGILCAGKYVVNKGRNFLSKRMRL